MQPGSPYHLIEAVGSCQVGSVWSAIDPQGRSLMVALLDPNVATDQRWREAFQEAANTLVQAGEPGYLYADFASGSPWVAYSAENGVGAERVFLALGMDFQPVPPDGLGPLDYTPIEPATQVTPATPPPAPEQPLPPAVIETTTPTEPPTTVLPPAQPGPPATESAEPVAAQYSPAAPQAPAPAAPIDDAEATQPTHGAALPAGPSPIPPAPVSPWAGQQFPVSPPPQQSMPVSAPPPVSGAPHPTSGAPRPVSGTPMSPAYGQQFSPAYGQPLSPAYGAPAHGPRPPQGPAPYDPYAPVSPPPRRSRAGLWVGIAVAVLVLIAGGGGVYAWSASGDNPNPPEHTNAATEAPLPTATPLSPGVEPPEDGNWSAKWPKFADPPDKVRELSLEGISFKFLVPRDWECQAAGSGDGFVKYNCGGAPGGPEIGGELVVRECPQPCDETRRVAMRKAEEAWGLQWKRGSRTSAYAETNEIDGQPRYGLVIVAYFRSSPDQAVDRQLVFRMTAPVAQADAIRKTSRSVRTSAGF